MDSTAIVAAAVGGIPAIMAAAFAARSSSQANRSTEEQADRKLNAEALERSQQFYEKLLADAEARLDRLMAQSERLQARLDAVTELLSHEQDVSLALRSQIRRARFTASTMGTTVEQFSTELADRDSKRMDATGEIPRVQEG